jgi:hypothetical protein
MVIVFPVSLAGNNLIIPGHGDLVSDIPTGDGKNDNLFFTVYKYSATAQACLKHQLVDFLNVVFWKK